MRVIEKLENLRNQLKKNNIDYYIIPSEDAHQSEYVCGYYKGRAYMSGFTGSAGTLLVSLNNAILWTDGRYFIQAENQLKGSSIEMYKMRTIGVKTLEEYLFDTVKEGEVIGFDGDVFSTTTYKKFEKLSKEGLVNIKTDIDLLNKVWCDRPKLPKEKAFIHDIKFAGKSAKDKISDVLKEMEKKDADSYIISSLDDIAWLLNIRGNDVKNNPIVMAHVIITRGSVTLYIDKVKTSNEFIEYLEADGISISDYKKVYEDASILEGNILIDPSKINANIYKSFSDEANIIEILNITTNMKAIKNDIEIDNTEKAQIRDGVAMVKFIKWLKENIGKVEISEISASDKLESFRSHGENYRGLSFDTIAGHKDHGAMMHYFATEESNYILEDKGFLLVDSGAQYLDGTTDITRTFVLGDLTTEEKEDFTLVLKGHINLAMAKFLKGTSGSNIDILARKPLWDKGIDYKCGTGHGVGFFLNVHEGPQSISQVPNKVALELGMITTNEPGIYRTGKHGIRTENTTLVVRDRVSEEFGEFYKFKTISYCPIDIEGINVEILSVDEILWLNEYHKMVFDKLAQYLNIEEINFLKGITRKL